ncbi:hypothetical protein ACFO5Q_00670 [Kordiimonas lipolytica]|uniref:5-bromo-4-chloroindolyl phosphate hydrolysis protein n=1 Tax=Kordiimonas lipolytica TaxID=1662421 RepID=A0ABV8U5F4_9PROT|nr:hypothetical protein [Kordiimonas lipolytica]
MKTVAYLLVMLSFLAGAFLTSLDKLTLDWITFIPVMLVGVVGVVMLKRAEAAEAKCSEKLEHHRGELKGALENILKNLEELHGRKDKVPTYDMRFEIDRLFRDDLTRFADARDSMKHIFGLQAYADIMSSFAAGERYINRVWSASTDGYVDEVLMYVDKSLNQFRHAMEEFDKAVRAAA